MRKRTKTAQTSKSILSGYDALYVRRAKKVLPVLVQLAHAGHTIPYSHLARVLGMPNARNLNCVLGSVGATLEELSRAEQKTIPPLQSIVVNKGTGLPGEGFDQFLKNWFGLPEMTLERRRALLPAVQKEVFQYKSWGSILKQLHLEAATPLANAALERGPSLAVPGRGPAESAEHIALKQFLADNPQILGLSRRSIVELEHPLHSGDEIDVLFTSGHRRVAVEAKSVRSSEKDILRGVFQCVKYEAVLNAESLWRGDRMNCSAILALEEWSTEFIKQTAALLGVSVLEKVRERACCTRSN